MFRARIREAKDWKSFGRTKSHKFLPPLEGPKGTLTSLHLESAAPLLRTQEAVDDPDTDLPAHVALRDLAAATYQSRLRDVPFTEGEVEEVIGKLSPRSAPGPDGITHGIVKGLYELRPEFVMLVLNAAWRLGHFPRCWRRGRITLIPKPNRPPQCTTSYRLICVNSVFEKVLERLLNG
ncbi:hypothetical protein MRX96_020736 [Rhipicephalus microplus]